MGLRVFEQYNNYTEGGARQKYSEYKDSSLLGLRVKNRLGHMSYISRQVILAN
jgi:hypothetical protein